MKIIYKNLPNKYPLPFKRERGKVRVGVLKGSILLIMFILTGIFFLSFAQEIYELERIVVTATRYPKNIMDITRTIIVIDSAEIIKYSSLTDILEGTSDIDTKIRGEGIQADPSIRGSTFQQILVMIDGVRVNDPQTGHHNLNIPNSFECD